MRVLTFKYVTPRKAEKCAQEIIKFLLDNDLWDGVCIYVNGYRYKSERDNSGKLCVVKEEDTDPRGYFSYVNEQHFISMSFEGAFRGLINCDWLGGESDKLRDEFDDILQKYGYYYELGNHWNLSAYKI